MSDCCLFLRGEFFIKDAPNDCLSCGLKGANYKKIGNTSLCEVTINSLLNGVENKHNKVDPKNRLSITSVTMAMTIECASRENLLMAFNGTENIVTAEYKEERICYDGDNFLILSYTPIDPIVMTGKDSFGNDIQIFEEGIDFTISGSKIELLFVAENVETIQVSYNFDSSDLLSFSVIGARPKYKDLFFKGENASTGESVEVRFFRVLFNPISTFDIVSKDQFFNLPLNGVVEESSQGYFKLDMIGDEDELGEIIY